MPLRSANFRIFLLSNTFLSRKSALRSSILFASPEVVHTAQEWRNRTVAEHACSKI
jgi:hypothetical protein